MQRITKQNSQEFAFMDLVSRLKQYLDSRQISITQFADECGIPRPTGSQLLAGRNKKVSDEIISKIHAAYPDLNIVWLMFGEGYMVTGTNIEISEPQNSLFSDNSKEFSSENQKLNTFRTTNIDSIEVSRNSVEELNIRGETSFEQPTSRNSQSETKKQSDFLSEENKDAEVFAKMVNSKIVEREPAKKIASIIVLFTDNSFETFIPSTDN